MSSRFSLSLAVAALLGLLAACSYPQPMHEHVSNGPLPGVVAGQESAEVRKALGNPNSEASGWWMGTDRFNMRYKVWYYEGKGRVVFGPDSMTVSHSEADPSEDGRPSN